MNDRLFEAGNSPTHTTKILDYLQLADEDIHDPRRMNMVETIIKHFSKYDPDSSLKVVRSLSNKNVKDPLKFITEYCLIHDKYTNAMSVFEKKQYERELELYESK